MLGCCFILWGNYFCKRIMHVSSGSIVKELYTSSVVICIGIMAILSEFIARCYFNLKRVYYKDTTITLKVLILTKILLFSDDSLPKKYVLLRELTIKKIFVGTLNVFFHIIISNNKNIIIITGYYL